MPDCNSGAMAARQGHGDSLNPGVELTYGQSKVGRHQGIVSLGLSRLLAVIFLKQTGVLLCKLHLQVLTHRNCGGVLYIKCPKHLNLKAEDLRMYEG